MGEPTDDEPGSYGQAPEAFDLSLIRFHFANPHLPPLCACVNLTCRCVVVNVLATSIELVSIEATIIYSNNNHTGRET